jgi:hemolysin D
MAMGNKRTKDELEFLPAALEIQETPPLPAGRYILWAIMLFFVIGVAWASVGEVDIVAVAQGKIVPSGRVKVIQPLESGVVKRILVKQGQTVAAGEVLIELDNTASGADAARLEAQRLAAELERARLEAVLSALDEANRNDTAAPSDNRLTLKTPKGASADHIALQQARGERQLSEFDAHQASTLERIAQRRAERAAKLDRIEQLQSTLPLVTERADALKKLLKSNLGSRVQWTEAEEARITQAKQIDIEGRNLQAIDAAIRALRQERAALKHQMATGLIAELTEVENQLATIDKEIIKAGKRVALQALRSPVDGVVKQLAVHTIGGVVTPAQRLMEIVPQNAALEIEAWFQNKDIGFVEEGQVTEVKIEAFPFTKYGTIDGEIVTLSDDAVQDERAGLIYPAQVFMQQSTLRVEGKSVNLSPGMAVTVEAKTGKRRLIEYLLSPLLRFKQESARER